MIEKKGNNKSVNFVLPLLYEVQTKKISSIIKANKKLFIIFRERVTSMTCAN